MPLFVGNVAALRPATLPRSGCVLQPRVAASATLLAGDPTAKRLRIAAQGCRCGYPPGRRPYREAVAYCSPGLPLRLPWGDKPPAETPTAKRLRRLPRF